MLRRLPAVLACALLSACAGPSVNPDANPSQAEVYAGASQPKGLSAKEAATDTNVIGCVKVEYMIRTDGSTSDVRIIESVPAGYFDARVLHALEQIRFQPRDGIKLATRTFSFGPRQTREVLDSAAKLCEHAPQKALPPPPEGGLTGADAPLPYIGAPAPQADEPATKNNNPNPRRPGKH